MENNIYISSCDLRDYLHDLAYKRSCNDFYCFLQLDPQIRMRKIDKMTGKEFEKLLSDLFTIQRYSISETKSSKDQGADLILNMGYLKIAVQAKRRSNRIGNKAVQEVHSAKTYYNCNRAWVITNNYFTKPAIDLARSCNVELYDRNGLIQIINNATRY